MNFRDYLLSIGLLIFSSTSFSDSVFQYDYQYDGIKPTICDEHLPDQEARAACYLEYSSPNHPENQLAIPLACQDTEHSYQPVRYIYTQSGSYNERANASLEQPIASQGGFIKHDFSADGLPEYLFLERTAQDIRLVVCISTAKQVYERLATEIKLFEFNPKQDGMGSYQQHIKVLLTGQISIYLGAYEHNTGSYSTEHWYGWSAKRKAFVLDKINKESYRGDGLSNNDHDQYDWQSLRYQDVTDCSNAQLGFGCDHSTIETGIMHLHKERPILGANFYDPQFNAFEKIKKSVKPYTPE